MPNRDLKLKQASAVLGVPPKEMQNFVQSGGLRPRRVGALYYSDRKALVSAKVALYLKDSLGASTRYRRRFTGASRGCQASRPRGRGSTRAVRSSRDQPVSILISLRGPVAELDERLPVADQAKDLPRGRKRAGWKKELRAALQQGATNLEGVSRQRSPKRSNHIVANAGSRS